MEQNRHVARWVDQLDDMAVETTDAMLRATGGVQAPTVRALVDGLQPAFVGQLGCRPFYRGSDAHEAVAVMGLFGSMLDASRLLISYEHADMALAWQDRGAEDAPTGVVVVDAARDPRRDLDGGHTIRWHPVRYAMSTDSLGRPSILPTWGPPARYPGGQLPTAIAQLLAIWREPRPWADEEFLRVLAGWEQASYTTRWIERPATERHQPRWMQLLAPVM